MCGIIGIVNKTDCVKGMLTALSKLEYRGYDSSGVATITNNKIDYRKVQGKLANLKELIYNKPLAGNIGIGHTRWATHGEPSNKNAHPFVKRNCALVHNGIIENYLDIKKSLANQKIDYKSSTDTEVVAELMNYLIEDGATPLEAMKEITTRIEGNYALVFLLKNSNNLYFSRKGSPLVLGLSKSLNCVASDTLALPNHIDKVIYLEEGDIGEIGNGQAKIFDQSFKVKKNVIHDHISLQSHTSKNQYKHFMIKEIHYQSKSIDDTLLNFAKKNDNKVYLPQFKFDTKKINNLSLVACGTAFHACMISKYWFEEISKINTLVEIASEYRYRENSVNDKTLGVLVSQSGETMDTIKCLEKMKRQNINTASIVNVLGSSLTRDSDYILPTLAGPEIGVASTKAFTAQLTVLALLCIHIAQKKGIFNESTKKITNDLFTIPGNIKLILKNEKTYSDIAKDLIEAKSIFYVGRGPMYPLALEGALKLKEITYKHCEGYAAGELKHGPLALIEDSVPVVVLAPSDKYFNKTISNIQEIKARGGEIILITDKEGAKKSSGLADKLISLPDSNLLTAPILYSIPVQLIAYHLATLLGTDVDQPRNLAKSVTVE
ncbi:MAG: Glutamine--fructose-6-phosphate aminotransferase [isomerizing] [Alphaproteobacteria bacterium MarineAlpha5_Bin11]|nr:glutamine--fructose-6-phosphate transaminase (isomerizing) [Pelagibacteraceae bacterium]PPR44191.1 MAG: Glutamine--fructose-6-phosphate aminotransferase [isomerizing] [Alphaproteobacteria bacterium MarineAlpha5_Bin11]PPR51510.1 MAG: Glutamine--fructose-6-phosphate aminotransferase [isomerizing] [Alphaproteobacteria bacterium MarineAlpha5_Bin10]|tara:strand:- start:2012 stop:3829 length:1818 start_codon:yes stop_codon:yes gene_type:complete